MEAPSGERLRGKGWHGVLYQLVSLQQIVRRQYSRGVHCTHVIGHLSGYLMLIKSKFPTPQLHSSADEKRRCRRPYDVTGWSRSSAGQV